MTSSNTNNFTLSTGSLILEAFDRCGIRAAEITREQTTSAIRSANLEFSLWASSPVDLWEVELVQITLIQGQATYTLAPEIQLVCDAYCTLIQGSNPPIDRILVSIGRDEYATYSAKTTQGPPGQYWFQRTSPCQITLYPVPDGVTETYLNLYCMKRVQDVTNSGAQTLDIPYRFLDVIASNLSTRLAVKYAPEKYPLLKSISDEVTKTVWFEDQERVNIGIMPDFSIYQV